MDKVATVHGASWRGDPAGSGARSEAGGAGASGFEPGTSGRDTGTGEDLPCAWLALDADGRIARANAAAGHLLGAAPPALVGLALRDLAAPAGRGVLDGLVRPLLGGADRLDDASVCLRAFDGHDVPAVLWAIRRHGPEGPRVECLLAAAPERRRLDQALLEVRAHAEQLERMNAALRDDLRRARDERAAAEQRLQVLADQLPPAILVVDGRARIVAVNRAACRWYGRDADALLGASLVDGVGNVVDLRLAGEVVRALRGETAGFQGEWAGARTDGPRRVDARVLPLRDGAGANGGAVVIVEDVGERRVLEDALDDARARAAAVDAVVADAVITIDPGGTVAGLNAAAEALTGWRAAEATGTPLDQVLHLVPAEGEAGLGSPAIDPLAVLREGGSLHDLALRLLTRDGHPRPVVCSAVPVAGAWGRPLGSVLVLRDLGLLRGIAQSLPQAARHDPLTGLPNRALFDDRLAQALAQASRRDQRLALLWIDVDRLGQVNAALGHAVGDRLLQTIALRLTGAVRAGDSVSRIGADEFGVLLAGVGGPDDVARAAEKLVEACRHPAEVDGESLWPSVSIGIAVHPDDGEDAAGLERAATEAMLEAREVGGGTYRFRSSPQNRRAAEQRALHVALRRGLERGELRLLWQPIFSLAGGELTGAEALLRWRHPELGEVPPQRFLPVAEATRLDVPIGQWVVRQALREASGWRAPDGSPLPVTLNVSGGQLRDPGFADQVVAALQGLGRPPSTLHLDLAEGLLLRGVDEVQRLLARAVQLGVRLSIDDFGAGPMRLGDLRHLGFATLKLDPSFVHAAPVETAAAAILRAVIDAAHGLGRRTVGEGVEDPAQAEWLRANGCDDAQGFHFSPPVQGVALGAMLEESARGRRWR